MVLVGHVTKNGCYWDYSSAYLPLVRPLAVPRRLQLVIRHRDDTAQVSQANPSTGLRIEQVNHALELGRADSFGGRASLASREDEGTSICLCFKIAEPDSASLQGDPNEVQRRQVAGIEEVAPTADRPDTWGPRLAE